MLKEINKKKEQNASFSSRRLPQFPLSQKGK